MFIKLNPVTQKRLKRFKEIKRAYWSFWILLVTFVLSLGAEFYCNNVPIYVQFEGKHYFPVFKNYIPYLRDYRKVDFYPNGDTTVVNYKDLLEEEFFKKNPSNKMVFPLVPYGATENMPLSKVKTPKDITLEIEKEPEVGSIDITPEFEIIDFVSSEFFLNEGQEYKKQSLESFFQVSANFKNAVNSRFANQESPQYTEESQVNDKKIKITLTAFKTRGSNPRRVRMGVELLRDPKAPSKGFEEKVVFTEELNPIKGLPKVWSALNEEQRNLVMDKLKQSLNGFVDPLSMPVGKDNLVFKFQRALPNFPLKPSAENYFGFTYNGRDVFVQIIYGFRIALSFALILVVFTIAIGVIVGAIQGFFGGLVDLLGQRAIEIWAALPFLYVMILLGSIHGQSFQLLLFVYGVFNWIGISYYMRAEFLKLRKSSYVEAAKCLGLSDAKIMWKHILPNAMVPIITFFPFMLVGAIGSLTALDFLGFGLPPETPSWGNMISQGVTHKGAWWLIFFPSLFLFLVIFLAILIGDGLRAAFDPRKFHKID